MRYAGHVMVFLVALAFAVGVLVGGLPPGHAPAPWGRPPVASPAGVPADGGLWLVVVEADGQRPPWAARVLTDRTLWRDLEGRGHVHRVLSYSDPACAEKGYAQWADKVDKPALLLATAGGKVLNVRTLPDSADGVRNAVKEYAK